jgi:hypothetical protein
MFYVIIEMFDSYSESYFVTKKSNQLVEIHDWIKDKFITCGDRKMYVSYFLGRKEVTKKDFYNWRANS